jgi:hypothetical protein
LLTLQRKLFDLIVVLGSKGRVDNLHGVSRLLSLLIVHSVNDVANGSIRCLALLDHSIFNININ